MSHSATVSEPSPALTPPPGNPRFALMDSIRGVAILLVVLNHVSALAGDWSAHGWGRLALYADAGVTVFFVLSGFLLYRPFVVAHAGQRAAPRVSDYLRRRVLRVVPAYWLALTILAVWPGIAGAFSGDFWRYYFFLQIYEQGTFHLGIASAWSLCVEVAFYLLLPLFAATVATIVSRRARRRWWEVDLFATAAFAAVGLISVALVSLYNLPLPRLLYSFPATTEWFAMGMALAIATVAFEGRERKSRVLRLLAAYPGLAWILAAGAFAFAVYPFDIRLQTPTAAIYVANRAALGVAALLIVVPAAFEGRGLLRRLLASRWLSWIGLISYGIFLWHLSLAAWLAGYRFPGDDGPGLSILRHVPHALKTPVLFVTTFGLSCLAAAASYYLVELRFLRLKERRPRVSFSRAEAAVGP
jgi:peptidoglycan/LPS O-acetylase OafA/YrhL